MLSWIKYWFFMSKNDHFERSFTSTEPILRAWLVVLITLKCDKIYMNSLYTQNFA